ncbi:MAG: hypothetical protein HWE16_00835 [Gammaproteobacteria bacterium]|nr:hypothetical protein [Gammaproteobacteria bacterium]
MKNIFSIIAVSLLFGCGQDNNDQNNNKIAVKNHYSSPFVAQLNGKEYSVNVKCSHFDKDYFQFNSDANDITDSNGDGLIISGMETNGKFSLTIIDHGKTYSVGKLANFAKEGKTAKGSGVLFDEDTSSSLDIKFSVDCR